MYLWGFGKNYIGLRSRMNKSKSMKIFCNNIFCLDKPMKITYENLFEIVKKHYGPDKDVINHKLRYIMNWKI